MCKTGLYEACEDMLLRFDTGVHLNYKYCITALLYLAFAGQRGLKQEWGNEVCLQSGNF